MTDRRSMQLEAELRAGVVDETNHLVLKYFLNEFLFSFVSRVMQRASEYLDSLVMHSLYLQLHYN